MSGWGAAFFWPHTVRVRDRKPGGGLGPSLGQPRSVKAEVSDEQSIVRNADGQEVVSSSSVTVPLSANVPVGSMVTVWPGAPGEREAEVLAVQRVSDGPPLPSFLVLSLK